MRARQLKFRAWIKREKRMIDWESMLSESEKPLKDFFSEHLNSVVLMQSTGLTDLNGKEIYEGDILRTTFIRDMGEAGKATSVVIWNEHIGAWQITYTGGSGGAASDYIHRYKHEIIGNGAQNSELLPSQGGEEHSNKSSE